MAVKFKVIGKSREQTVGKFGNARSVFVISYDCKFVASKPGDEGVVGDRTQAVGNVPQQRIADGMPVNIVDLLKSIEVHAQKCETSALSLRQSQRRGQALIEGGSIWKIRQRIAMRHMRDTLLRLPTLRHIIDQGQKIFRFSVVLSNGNLLRGDNASPFGRGNDI